MTPAHALALLAGAGVGAGAWLLAHGLRRRAPRPRAARSPLLRANRRQLMIAGSAVVATAVISRWPVAALAAGALAWYWPRVIGLTAGDRQLIARLEALATWTESLRDAVAGAIGLEQAIPATAASCGPAIRPHILRLAGRLQARIPMPEALRALAVELRDGTADLVVAALVLSAELRGPGLRATLSSLADSARAELDMRRKVEAGRTALRRGAAIIAVVTCLFAGGLMVFNRRYLRPYDSLAGQLALAIVCAFFAAGFSWLGKLSRAQPQGRIFATPPKAGL